MAHPLDLGILILENQARLIHARLEVNPRIACKLLKFSDSCTEAEQNQLEASGSRFYEATLKSSPLRISNRDCHWQSDFKVKLESVVLYSLDADVECDANAGETEIDLPFLQKLDSSYNLIGKIRIGQTERVLGASPLHPRLHFDVRAASVRFQDFMLMGLEHIGVWPSEWRSEEGWHLPYGMDHILFVLALLLAGDQILALTKLITGFTVGHTLALALAVTGIVQVSGRWIEAVIAFTIALVALESLVSIQVSKAWKVTLVIGLIHGLGFANALLDLRLGSAQLIPAVVGFNLGVECGQLAIILPLFPLLSALRRTYFGRTYVVRGFALFILGISLYWCWQRSAALLATF